MQRKLVFVCLVCQLGLASASPKDFDQHRSGPVELIVDEVGGSLEIPVQIGGETWVKFPHEISGGSTLASRTRNPGITVDFHGSNLRMRPDRNVTDAAKTGAINVNLDSGTAHYSLLAYVVDASNKAPPYYVVRTRSEIEAREAAVQARLATERAAIAAKDEDRAQRARARQFLQTYELTPRIDQRTANGGPVRARLVGGSWGNIDEFFAQFEITNTGIAPYRFDAAEASSEQQKIADVKWLLDLPGSDEQHSAVIQPGKSVKGVVILSKVTPSDIAPLTVTFSGPNSIKPIVAKAPEWLIPRTVEDIKAERDQLKKELEQERTMRARQDAKELEDAEKARAESGKVSVDLQGVYGAIWLANPLDDKQLDPTSLAGLGARITYGMSKRLSVEAEVMGARTGEAGFQTMDGELMRRATLGRAQGGILARFGEGRYRPFMRLGLGLQGASHTAEILMEDGSRMPGPNVELTFDVTAAFGGGLDIRLGESFIAGIGLSALWLISGGQSGVQAMEGGIHLGYSWKP